MTDAFTHNAALLILHYLEVDGVVLRDPDYDGPCAAINPAAIEPIAAKMLDIFAELIATIIDAGSERDAVNENADLLYELQNELAGWVGPTKVIGGTD